MGTSAEILSSEDLPSYVVFWAGWGSKVYSSVSLWIYCLSTVQAYLGDIAGSVPDHCNKASIAVKRVKARRNLLVVEGLAFNLKKKKTRNICEAQ